LVCGEKAKGQLKTKALMLGFQNIKKTLARIHIESRESAFSNQAEADFR
jgi:hypothetical protein